MSLTSNIARFSTTPGIEAAVVVHQTDTGKHSCGNPDWHNLLSASLDLFAVAQRRSHTVDEKSIRLVVGKHTIVVQRESDETVAVVLPTGHAIAKSLRRMIRRMARKTKAPA